MSRRQQRRRASRRRVHMAVASGGLAAVASLSTGAVAQAAQTFTVTNLNDSGTGSLRQATLDLNADTTDTAAPGDSIVFASGVTGTLALTTADGPSSSLYINRPVQITGPGANQLTVHAAPAHRVLYIEPTSGVTAMGVKLTGLTLNGGSAAYGAGISSYRNALELDAVAITGNTANECSGICDGGVGSTLTMFDSTISGNTATGSKSTGGAYSYNGGTVTNSTITGNSGSYGAGLSAYGPLTVKGSTVAGNTLTNPNAGQILEKNSTLTLQDSIVAGSGSAPDVALTSGASGLASFSLIRNTGAVSGGAPISTDATDVTGVDPQLGPLQGNGGPTATMLPSPTSPVLDRGNSEGLAIDQRGLPRPFALPTITTIPAGGDRADIGAVEVETPTIGAISPTSGSAGTAVGIVGVGFSGATQVLFGSIPASSFTVLGDGAIAAVAPVGAGTEDVRVITPLGQSPAGFADRFTFPTFTPTVSKPHAKLSGNKVNTGIKVSCPSGGLSCGGTFKATAFIKHRKTKLAGGTISLSAGQGKTITFKLGSKALKQLKSAGKLKITIQIVIADGSENPVTVNRTITLKIKHKKH